jgi:hypothetical protein
MASRGSYLKAALLMPANLFALAAGGVASWVMGDLTPLLAAGGASTLYLGLVSFLPSFRRSVRAQLSAQAADALEPEEELAAMLAELAPSQKEHYETLRELKSRIVQNYTRVPGGGALAEGSARRIDGLLTAFVRLLSTLNAYRRYLGATDKKAIEDEVAQLKSELAGAGERLKEVKQRRVEILELRLARFNKAEESREVVSHQLAGIEDLLKLTLEQSIAMRDPEAVGRQLEGLSAEVAATEESVREMERFMEFHEEVAAPVHAPVKVRP